MPLSIAFYSTVSTDEAVYIIGGRQEPYGERADQYTNALAQFRNDRWKIFEQRLFYQRVGHASILIDIQKDGRDHQILYIFGGSVRNSQGDQE